MQMKQEQRENDLLSLMSQSDDAVSLPYAGTSGWSGTDTSRERAITADTSGDTKKRQKYVMFVLQIRGTRGITWKELAELTGWHHGQASGVLSVLHKEGRIARLLDKRARCRIYVHPSHVGDRLTDSQGRKPKPCPNCGYVND
jgi:hypothetical protein